MVKRVIVASGMLMLDEWIGVHERRCGEVYGDEASS